MRIGNAIDGSVATFIPDASFDLNNASATGAHGVSANSQGVIFGGEVGGRTVMVHQRR